MRSRQTLSSAQFIGILGVTAVLFFLSLIPLEVIPEIPVDIDQKAFFIPFLLAALLPVGRATLAVGLGMALGEGIRDLMEGYELDDPFGFVGYIAGVLIFGHMAALRPLNRAWPALSAVVGAAVQSAFEASTLLLFGSEAASVALYSGLGNTLTHGVLWGAVPLALTAPLLHGRFERLLGFAPKGARSHDPQPLRERAREASAGEPLDGILCADGLTFRYPATGRPAVDGVRFALKRGEVLGLLGPAGAGKTSLCLCLTGLAPRATGGDLAGSVRLDGIDPQTAPRDAVAGRMTFVAENVSAQLTQVRALDEVAAPLMNRGMARDEARARAREVLRSVGVADTGDLERRRVWELSDGEQRRVVLAAALAGSPDVLLLDGVAGGFDPQARDHLRRLVREAAENRAVLLAENDPDLLLDLADRVAVMVDGRLCGIGPAAEILADRALMERAGFAAPLRLRAAAAAGLAAGTADLDALRARIAARPPAAAARPGADAPPADGRAGVGQAAEAPPVLAMADVTFSYGGGVPTIDGVSLTVAARQTVGLLGANGAGKTTLARLAVGLLRPDRGCVRIAGRDAAALGVSDRAAVIGYAVQNPDESISERTVADEIAFPLRRSRDGDAADEDARRRRVEEVAETVRLDRRLLACDPTALSFGQRKLVTIATALARAPDLLILDEPMVGLDGAGQRHLRGVVARLRRSGTAVLVLDHNADLVADVADRVLALSGGRTMAEGPPREVFARPAWERLKEAALAPPRAARLSHRLGLDAFTADELIGQIRGATP
ncbi:ABC transporter ATP-binding protein [Azospirillum sp. ST 5-10]|uniref:ABC transporter ATP-binding protein n=1 Tax=unclassified Azospirillum TaxID=2630922 RepID=UPI003F4A108A